MLNEYVVIAVILIFSGCNFISKNRPCQDKQTFISRYKNGALNAITIVNCNDTGLTKTILFYENGDTSEINYKRNGKPEGQTKVFTQSGKLRSIIFNSNGIADSAWSWDDRNGGRKFVQYFTDFPAQCADLAYDLNGVLKNYVYFIYKKDILKVVYSPDGAITHVEGEYLTTAIGNQKKYNVGDSIIIYFFVATPPNDSVRFSAALHYQNDVDSMQVSELPIVNSKAIFSSRFNKRGYYSIRFDLLVQHKKGSLKPIHKNAALRFDLK